MSDHDGDDTSDGASDTENLQLDSNGDAIEPKAQLGQDATLDNPNSENGLVGAEKSTEEEDIQFSRNHRKVIVNRSVCYQILNICFHVSRYLETYYRMDDELSVKDVIGASLKISDLWSWLYDLVNIVKTNLSSHTLPPSEIYKQTLMVAILQNIRAVPSAIRPELLMPGTLEFEDCAVVRSGVPPTFYSDDGGDQTESTLPPINMQYIDMNIRRPFCTDGHWQLINSGAITYFIQALGTTNVLLILQRFSYPQNKQEKQMISNGF